MKTIFLLRHAKSSWNKPELDDFERPLAPRGIKSAEKIGKYLKKEKLLPDIIYCSKAVRAKETWELVNRIVKKKNNINYKNKLYMANFSDFLNIIKETKDNFKSLMLISHNPGIENFALEIIKNKESEKYKNIDYKYPTGALSIIKFNIKKWNEVTSSTGEIYEFIKPKEL